MDLRNFAKRRPFLATKEYFTKILKRDHSYICRLEGTDCITLLVQVDEKNQRALHIPIDRVDNKLHNDVVTIMKSTKVVKEGKTYYIIDDLLYYNKYPMTYSKGGYAYSERLNILEPIIDWMDKGYPDKYRLNIPVTDHNWQKSFRLQDWIDEWSRNGDFEEISDMVSGIQFINKDMFYEEGSPYTYGNYLFPKRYYLDLYVKNSGLFAREARKSGMSVFVTFPHEMYGKLRIGQPKIKAATVTTKREFLDKLKADFPEAYKHMSDSVKESDLDKPLGTNEREIELEYIRKDALERASFHNILQPTYKKKSYESFQEMLKENRELNNSAVRVYLDTNIITKLKENSAIMNHNTALHTYICYETTQAVGIERTCLSQLFVNMHPDKTPPPLPKSREEPETDYGSDSDWVPNMDDDDVFPLPPNPKYIDPIQVQDSWFRSWLPNNFPWSDEQSLRRELYLCGSTMFEENVARKYGSKKRVDPLPRGDVFEFRYTYIPIGARGIAIPILADYYADVKQMPCNTYLSWISATRQLMDARQLVVLNGVQGVVTDGNLPDKEFSGIVFDYENVEIPSKGGFTVKGGKKVGKKRVGGEVSLVRHPVYYRLPFFSYKLEAFKIMDPQGGPKSTLQLYDIKTPEYAAKVIFSYGWNTRASIVIFTPEGCNRKQLDRTMTSLLWNM